MDILAGRSVPASSLRLGTPPAVRHRSVSCRLPAASLLPCQLLSHRIPLARRTARPLCRCSASADALATSSEARPETEVEGLPAFLDSLKWDSSGLVAAIVQHVDTGELLMQAFADRAAVAETFQTGLATFYSRSRKGRWCKGETSGHFIKVLRIHPDCDRDSLVYLSEPIGPACHTGAQSCWFSGASLAGPGGALREAGRHDSRADAPLPVLLALERTIQQRADEASATQPGDKPSWTARLLADPALLCAKVREEAGELAQTLEAGEGPQRAASEAADLLYHAMVLLHSQGVPIEDVMRTLRSRFGTSGVEEKAARKQH